MEKLIEWKSRVDEPSRCVARYRRKVIKKYLNSIYFEKGCYIIYIKQLRAQHWKVKKVADCCLSLFGRYKIGKINYIHIHVSF